MQKDRRKYTVKKPMYQDPLPHILAPMLMYEYGANICAKMGVKYSDGTGTTQKLWAFLKSLGYISCKLNNVFLFFIFCNKICLMLFKKILKDTQFWGENRRKTIYLKLGASKNPNQVGLLKNPWDFTSVLSWHQILFWPWPLYWGRVHILLRTLSLCHDVSFWIENVDVGVLLS